MRDFNEPGQEKLGSQSAHPHEDEPQDLGLIPADLAGARRFNALLSALPRFNTSRRWNARIVEALVKGYQALSDRRQDQSENEVLQVPGTSSSIRLTRPPCAPSALLLHFHGGAWIMGKAVLEDRLARAAAQQCGMLVAVVDFRNATDDDLSATIETCVAATAWTAANLNSFGVDRMLITGESSGAHLAMEALLALRSQGRHHSVHGFCATCGAFDLDGSESLKRSDGKALLIDGPSALDNLRRLKPSLPEHLRHGPLHADLNGLPPALFIAGARDPIRDDSIGMHARWNAVNGNARLLIVPEGVHGFNRMPTRLAKKTNAFVRKWLCRRMERVPTSLA
jgi:acetyl esterase/lipase